MKKNINNVKPLEDETSLFFWLGAEGDFENLSEDEFMEKIIEEQERVRKWQLCEDATEEGIGG